MAFLKQPILNTPTTSREVSGGPAPFFTPFRIYIVKVNDDKSCTIRISRYSSVLNSPNIKDTITLVGVDIEMDISYSDKVWLEVFYDRNLVPIFGIINSGPKWAAQTANPANTTELQDVYPEELEFITHNDLTAKVADLDLVNASIISFQNQALTQLSFQKDVGILTQTQYADLVTATNDAYNTLKTTLVTYKKDMNQFFQNAPTGTWKKLFRTFTLIGYTTYDLNPNLDGSIVTPRQIAPAGPDGVRLRQSCSALEHADSIESDL